MKKLLLVILGVGLAGGAIAESQNDRLVELSRRVHRLIQRNADYLSQRERRQVRQRLQEIRRIVRGSDSGVNPPPANRGYYCSAACTRSNGNPDFRYTRGDDGEFLAQAKQKAIEAVRKSLTCSFVIEIVECEAHSGQNLKYTALAACTKSTGGSDLRYSRSGTADNPALAREKARANLRKSNTCSFDIRIHETSDGWSAPAYCVASCQKSSGGPDNRYSRGSQGENRVDAMANAISELRKSYTCAFGIVVDDCGGL